MSSYASGEGRGSLRPVEAEPLWRHLVGGVLRRERLDQGRTLREVAEAARISMPYLSELERGRKEGSSEVLAAIARALGFGLTGLLLRVQAELERTARLRAAATDPRRTRRPGAPAPGRTGAGVRSGARQGRVERDGAAVSGSGSGPASASAAASRAGGPVEVASERAVSSVSGASAGSGAGSSVVPGAGSSVGSAAGSSVAPPAGASVVPGAGSSVVPGAGSSVVPPAGSSAVPGAGASVVPGAGAPAAPDGASSPTASEASAVEGRVMPLVEGRMVAPGEAAVPASLVASGAEALVVSVVAGPRAVSVVAKPTPPVAAELRRGDVRLAA